MNIQNLFKKLKDLFKLVPYKPTAEMTDEQLISEYKPLYDKICVFNATTTVRMQDRLSALGLELDSRRYNIIGGASGVTIVKREIQDIQLKSIM